jgi:hypothetical protein
MVLVMLISYRLNRTLLNPNLSMVFQSRPLEMLRIDDFASYFLFNFPEMYALPLSRWQLIWGTLFALLSIILTLLPKARPLVSLSILGVTLVAAQVLFSPVGYRAVHGFLTVAPHVLFAVWYFSRRESYRNSVLPDLLLGATLVFMLGYVYKSWTAAGGLQWGPRYLLSFYPLLVVCAVIAIAQELKKQGNHTLVKILVVAIYIIAVGVGFGFSIRGIASAHRLERYAQQTEEYVHAYSDLPTIVNCNINALIPSVYWKQPVFSLLHADMDQWAANATQVGFDQFYRLGFDLCFLNNIDEIDRYRLGNPSGIQAEICSISNYLTGVSDYCQPLPVQ